MRGKGDSTRNSEVRRSREGGISPPLVLTIILLGVLLSGCSGATDQTAELATEAAVTIQAQATERAQTAAIGTATAEAVRASSPTPLPSPIPPTPLPTSTATASPEPTAPPCTHQVGEVEDLGVPDLVRLVEGQIFDKTWRLTNGGTCTWNSGYELTFVNGERMGGPESLPLEGDVEPGESVELSMRLNAPSGIGIFSGNWMLQTETGEQFGTGEAGDQPLTVRVDVISEEMAQASAWTAEYFDNGNLNGLPVLTRFDAAVDFNWGTGSPAPALPKDRFSVRWTSQREFEADTYRFRVRADDAIRLYVDNNLVIDSWIRSDIRWQGVTVTLEEGKHSIKLEYGERIAGARVLLDWGPQ